MSSHCLAILPFDSANEASHAASFAPLSRWTISLFKLRSSRLASLMSTSYKSAGNRSVTRTSGLVSALLAMTLFIYYSGVTWLLTYAHGAGKHLSLIGSILRSVSVPRNVPAQRVAPVGRTGTTPSSVNTAASNTRQPIRTAINTVRGNVPLRILANGSTLYLRPSREPALSATKNIHGLARSIALTTVSGKAGATTARIAAKASAAERCIALRNAPRLPILRRSGKPTHRPRSSLHYANGAGSPIEPIAPIVVIALKHAANRPIGQHERQGFIGATCASAMALWLASALPRYTSVMVGCAGSVAGRLTHCLSIPTRYPSRLTTSYPSPAAARTSPPMSGAPTGYATAHAATARFSSQDSLRLPGRPSISTAFALETACRAQKPHPRNPCGGYPLAGGLA